MSFIRINKVELLFVSFLVLCAAGCSTSKRISVIKEKQTGVVITLPESRINDSAFLDQSVKYKPELKKDTITVNIDGREMVLMNAIRDEETGEMVAHQELTAAYVTARFRNVAERHGKIDLEFEVRVPEELISQAWQLRFYPEMVVLQDTIPLEHVNITGLGYRKNQLRGYERYNQFLSRIVWDPEKFIDIRNLEIFLMRNLPYIYAFKTDSTYVSEVEFESYFGVSEQMAIDHYTNMFSKNMNERRKERRSKMYMKYVKAPIVTDGVRLDTVITDVNGDFIYNYVQTVQTRKGLRKIDVTLTGDVFESNRRLYTIPKTDPLTYYISSLSSFVDRSPRYLTKVIERRAEANAAWNIDFKVGKHDVDEALGENEVQIENIKMNLRRLMSNEEFILDSITISAFASPEGTVAANNRLSELRAAGTAAYFNRFVRQYRDSLKAEAGMSIVVGDDLAESEMTQNAEEVGEIHFLSKNGGENWDYLVTLIQTSDVLSEREKSQFMDALAVKDFDERENRLKPYPFYQMMKREIYPRLRKVQFNFFLHRKGMLKDTVHTTVLDSTYMKGVSMIDDRDYEGAASVLGVYNDYNTAIAYVSLDRNMSALAILEKLEQTAPVNYMLAVVYSRLSRDQEAVEKYLTSCRQDPSYVHRGNLDPEIAALIKKYNLNAQPEDEFEYSF